MPSGKIGLAESISMAVGGMVGGGIFAALGVVAVAADTLVWLAFVVAGAIALCAGYSFTHLNDLVDGHTGPITYVEAFTGNSDGRNRHDRPGTRVDDPTITRYGARDRGPAVLRLDRFRPHCGRRTLFDWERAQRCSARPDSRSR